MRGTTRLLGLGAAVVSAALLLAGCGGASNGSTDQGATTVRVAANTNATVLPVWVAMDKGYFADNGLNVEFTNVDNIATLPAAVGKSFDIALSTPTLLLSAASQGINDTWVSGSSVDTSQDTNTLLLAGKNSGIHSVNDLAGKTIGVLNDTGTIHIATLHWLKGEGVPINSLHIVQVDAPNMADQLSSGRVDAVEAIHPYTQALLKAGAVNLGAPYAHLADTVSGIMWISQQQWAKSNPKAVQEFVKSLDQAQSFIKSNDKAARAILQKHTGLPPEVVAKDNLPDFDTSVRPQDLNVWLQAMEQVTGFKGHPELGPLTFSPGA